MLHELNCTIYQHILLALAVQPVHLQVSFQVIHLQLLQLRLQNQTLNLCHQIVLLLHLHHARSLLRFGHVLLLDGFLLDFWFGLTPALPHLAIIFLLDGSRSGPKTTHSAHIPALPLTVNHNSFPHQINHIPKIVEPLKIWLQQIRSHNHIFLIQGMSLQMAVKFLKSWVLKIPKIEILDRKIVDKQLSDLNQLC